MLISEGGKEKALRGYSDNPSRLIALSQVSVPDTEIQDALSVLSLSPVPSYSAFTEQYVRILGLYRESLAPRSVTQRRDLVWEAIVSGEWFAWIYAIHEINEIAEFERCGVNPFDPQDFAQHFREAHFAAVRSELRFLRQWAQTLGEDVPESALFAEHPIQQGTVGFRQEYRILEQSEGWSPVSSEEQAAAQRFWAKRGRI